MVFCVLYFRSNLIYTASALTLIGSALAAANVATNCPGFTVLTSTQTIIQVATYGIYLLLGVEAVLLVGVGGFQFGAWTPSANSVHSLEVFRASPPLRYCQYVKVAFIFFCCVTGIVAMFAPSNSEGVSAEPFIKFIVSLLITIKLGFDEGLTRLSALTQSDENRHQLLEQTPQMMKNLLCLPHNLPAFSEVIGQEKVSWLDTVESIKHKIAIAAVRAAEQRGSATSYTQGRNAQQSQDFGFSSLPQQ